MSHPLIKQAFRNQIVLAIVLLAGGLLLLQIKSILVSLFIAYIIMAALSPIVTFLVKQRIPNSIATALTFVTTIALIVLLIIPLVPFFISQIQVLFVSFPRYLDNAVHLLGITIDPGQVNSTLASEIGTIGGDAFIVTKQIFGGIFSLLTIIVVSFYLLIDHKKAQLAIASLFPDQKHALTTLVQMEEKLGAWLRGQILLSFSIGIFTWIALTLFNLPFALPLALLAGMLEIVPTIGPIVSGIPAVIVAMSISPTMAIIIAFVYLAIHQSENHILVPKIMEKAVGLHPIIVIITVMVGAKLMGVLGALLAIPFLSVLIIIYKSLQTNK